MNIEEPSELRQRHQGADSSQQTQENNIKQPINKPQVATEAEPNPEDADESLFECNICLDTASQPVISMCGHLYCWPCIHQWMVSGISGCNTCPVCKGGLESKEKLIPIYTKGKNKDPREIIPDIPNRPNGQRTDAPPNNNIRFDNFFGGFQFNTGNNIAFHFGTFGLIPLGFQLAMNSGVFQNQTGIFTLPGRNDSVLEVRAFISRMLLMIGLLTFVIILLY